MKASPLIAPATIVAVAIVFASGWWIYQRSFASFQEASAPANIEVTLDKSIRHEVTIQGTPATPTVLADLSKSGRQTEVACTTCHTTRSPQTDQKLPEDLDEFHQGLKKQHGSLSCLSCHNADNYDTLRLADGSAVSFENTMQLCAQCHGPQFRDYTNGSHGGMNGYWDLSRGPRTRNACNVCHDPHAPAYPQLIPVFPPKDIELIKQKQGHPH
ncbi:hypothetical protein [Pelagicoccus mobilis]|uniref:Cytochrome c7-like domain-containing protein n=1 Tax=Pelagicoccus mobilis TaxID=415221 RepID=A0A934S2A6_9BACT|nr:hypothetical protein [Pelagicoccus mobilis]MBK1879885.1 hypothetical protein [Pelagicoccus mobilis]